jgi:ribosomal protein S12 methylthiotransferase accessory factor
MPIDPIEALVSPQVGLVTELSPQSRGPEEPVPPFLYTARLAHFDFRSAPVRDRMNAGKGLTEHDAKRSALGEAVERYCAFQWDAARIRTAPLAELDAAALTPEELVLFAPEQYETRPYLPWTPESPISWIEGVELPEGQPVWVPAGFVYLTQPTPNPNDYMIPASSNGCAAGPSVDAAVLGGLFELIERDAMLVTWMNRLPAVQIDMPRATPVSGQIMSRYRRFGVDVRLFLMRTDQAPAVVMALGFDSEPARPAVVAGMGCDLSPARAVEKALFELAQGRPSQHLQHRDRVDGKPPKTYADVRTLDDHPAFHAQAENLSELAFLWSGGDSVSLPALEDRSTGDATGDLEVTVAGLRASRVRASYVDLTLPDVGQAGYRVVRTLASRLQPIHFGHGEERLGSRRLLELPARLGLAAEARRHSDLNPCPHPMA